MVVVGWGGGGGGEVPPIAYLTSLSFHLFAVNWITLYVIAPTPEELLLLLPTVVGGEFLKWFNITEATVAHDPNSEDYT